MESNPSSYLKHDLKHIILFNIVTLVLTTTLLLPTILKFEHVFEHHTHEVCKNPQALHFHDIEHDCEFFKFKITPQITFEYPQTELVEIEDNYSPICSQYEHVSRYQRLPFSLRGPPV